MPNDLRTRAIVLRRTNYGETDRILNLLTPEGKISVLAKGVRKEKSKLAGSVELFTISDIVIHQHRSGGLSILTSARMLRFFSNIISDLSIIELASECLRRVEKTSESADSPDYFDITEQTLSALHRSLDPRLVRAWFTLNLAQTAGESINLATDIDGARLQPDLTYLWDYGENSLRPHPQGAISAPEIKLARLMLSARLDTISRIDHVSELVQPLEPLVRSYN